MQDPRGRIDTVPLLGVPLVPLIIALICTPALQGPHVDKGAPPIQLAEVKTKRLWIADAQDRVLVTLPSDGSLWFRGRRVEPEELVPIFTKAPRTTPILLSADADAAYGSVRVALRQVQRARRSQLRLLVRERN
jgi:biopolymer transport protein ExbD